MDLIPIVGTISSSVTVVLIVWLVTRARQRRAEAQMQMQTKLIERFGSAPELIQFLHSPAGRHFVAGVQNAPAEIARERVVAGFTRAIILISLGLAFVFIAFFYREDGWIVPASIVLSLGIGYLLATFVAWKFSKSLRDDAALPAALGNETR
jgi:hypothetical protein